MNRRTTNAILLRTRPLREADLLCTYLTEGEGRLTGVAANARRSQRRFGGTLELGTVGTLTYVERSGQELVRIDEFHVERTPLAHRTDLDVFAAMGVLLEIAEATTVERQVSGEKFHLLREALYRLSDAPRVVALQWCVRWLGVLGLAPNLAECVRCGKSFDSTSGAYWSPLEGGAVCHRCLADRAGVMTMTDDDQALWQQLAAVEWVDEATVVWHRARPLFCHGLWEYLCHIVGRPLKSRGYWEGLWVHA